MSALRPYQKKLVNAYFILHFARFTPQEIVNICIYYCFLLDEFDARKTSSKLSINGINNTVIRYIDGMHNTNNNHKKTTASATTKNIINSPANYHWAFDVTNSKNSIIEFFLICPRHNNSGLSYIQSICCWRSGVNDKFTLHIYLDTERNQVMNVCGPHTEEVKINEWDEINNCRLKVCISENTNATVEIIQYHNSNFYTHKLLYNPYDPIANVGYANSIFDINIKIKYYFKALSVSPYVEPWNDEYLSYLIQLLQYDEAYKHAVKFKKGENAIAALIAYYYKIDKYDKAHNLFPLLDENALIKNDLYFELAHCNNELGYGDVALKYYQKYLDHRGEDATNRDNIAICIGNMARILFRNDKYEPALDLFLSLTQEEMDEMNVNDDIACCYSKMKQFEKARIYYELHIKKNPNDIWGYKQISYLFDDMGEHKSETKYLLKALKLAKNDKERVAIYTSLGVNEYLERNIHKAIDYGKQALDCFNSSDVDDIADDIVIELSNLGKYYYKINEYEQSFKYLSRAIETDSNHICSISNYAIILYHLKRFDESIVYLKKSIERKHEMKDPEGLADCLYVYGMILNNKHEFDKSNEMCLEAVNHTNFEKYKDKKKVYLLMSDNYAKLLQHEKAQEYLKYSKIKYK